MERQTRCDSNLKVILWYFPLDYTTYIYECLYHCALNNSSNYLWTGQRQSIYDFFHLAVPS